MRSKSLQLPLLIGIVMQLSQQLTGINAVSIFFSLYITPHSINIAQCYTDMETLIIYSEIRGKITK